MRVDAHQHFWQYSAEEYPWIGDGMERLALDYLPADLKPLIAAEGIAGSVAVQARQVVGESDWLLDRE
ncbi:amidohydrolase, partial [bacterium]|nr:amidohydrolase [bacterium]